MIRRIAVAVLAALLVVPGIGFGQEESFEQLVVQMAESAGDHTALARYYMERAEEAREEMRRHEAMAQSYRSGRAGRAGRMRGHCLALASKFEEIAAEFDALAALHHEESRDAPE